MPAFPKPHSYRHKRYLVFIRRQPCIVAGCKEVSEAAHIGRHGTGIKTDDFRTLSICHAHHVAAPDAIHRLGERRFEERFNLDLKELQLRFLIRFLAEELGCDDDKENG